MIAMSLAEVAAIVEGRLAGADPDALATGKVEFDSRKVAPGDLFLAVPGERVDGHDYAEAAIASGAVAVLATRPVPVSSILVADPIAALTALATASARRLTATVVALTGSSGKTSTKDLLAQLLQGSGNTVAPPGSFNNELGHPYTVLLADADTRYLVLETSARGLGHIRHLVDIAPPSVAAVLNVGTAHLAEFGTVATIAQAKGELIEQLPAAAAGGMALLNADDPLVLAMADRTRARVLTFGESPGADIRAERVEIDRDGRASFELVTETGQVGVRLTQRGEHQVANALAAAGLALACGLDLAAVAAGLSAATAQSHWRMEVTETAAGVTVVNDAYNASPESMRAALKTLAIMSEGRRSVAVLGHMSELGSDSISEHDRLGRLIVRLDIEHLIAVGPEARPIANGAALEGSWNGESEWVPDVEAAAVRLSEIVEAGDVVLIKGSRSAGMERVAHAVLKNLDRTAGAAAGEHAS
ncbi:UDP-N-acetylmuramoyl-tripeptide--D-alanyl-D-alanine ligase [Jatrophihabitans lederbergiae]|uniref:UDP-N-acetylmuramoyl-tripeptide--D-alanyl-D-alanine ligase n=1 Tax=Jatrophihabitans lederbergiae TaxID=3075547 RepID=A0ABU2J8J7_9ACTN|nr:UDP-N-acetylmuramoyl-tripeptide--D-alanyl-D-alanine ligase [Jatrophihabitans sp. DSM 44399]MDT0261312.1 UDP-N-acetylmuramoyl-tripeptide--D-alanyl-D-alanine ligase [Jatrophihabitans sp. DSM 44399]